MARNGAVSVDASPHTLVATVVMDNAQTSLLEELVRTRRTLVVVGPGGVGKTTTSAAIAMMGARMGLNVLVLTVDPAKRLATSLGMSELGNEEARVSPALFAEAGIDLGAGALHAMMLDTKTTFDELIDRHAPDPASRQRILDNPFYQQASTALAGSQEYMAMEKLYELRQERDYDLIVLDTPPTSNALDFLNAPDRLEDFLDSGALQLLLKGAQNAGRWGLGSLFKVNQIVLKGLDRFVGGDTFTSVLDFIQSFSEMYGGFKERAGRVREILRGDDVAFVVVSSTDAASIDEAAFFHSELAKHHMPFGALLVNRVRESWVGAGTGASSESDGITESVEVKSLGPTLVAAAKANDALKLYNPRDIASVFQRAAEAVKSFEALTRVDRKAIEELGHRLGSDVDKIRTVRLFDRDIHNLDGLAAFADVVFQPTPADSSNGN